MTQYRDIQRYIPNETQVSARDLNDIVRRIERLEKLNADLPLEIIESYGHQTITLHNLTPTFVRFQLVDNLDYYKTARANRLTYIPSSDPTNYEVAAGDDDFITVWDALGIWSGEGNTTHREGDKGYASPVSNKKGVYEVIALQTRARVIYFELVAALSATHPLALVKVSYQPPVGERAGYLLGRDEVYENLLSSSSSSSSSSGERQEFFVHNPKTFAVSYMFNGDIGHRGWAVWSEYYRRYWIIQMECP